MIFKELSVKTGRDLCDPLEEKGCASWSTPTWWIEDVVTAVDSLLYNTDLTKTKEHEKFFVVNNSEKKEMNGNLGKLTKPAIVTRGSSKYDKGYLTREECIEECHNFTGTIE
jgi:hypothetical protein